MTRTDYTKLFLENRKTMEAASEPFSDASRGQEALNFLYNNRRTRFTSPEELEELILRAAMMVGGSEEPESLFRADETEGCHARLEDIPAFWGWFVKTLWWMLNTACFEAEETAAFCEYILYGVGRFFRRDCCTVAMLMGCYVFMRCDLPGVQYISREEYDRMTSRREAPTPAALRQFLADEELESFIRYYGTLCPGKNNFLKFMVGAGRAKSRTVTLRGNVTEDNCETFRRRIEALFTDWDGKPTVFDCKGLLSVCTKGADAFLSLERQGYPFTLRNANLDCALVFRIRGLQKHFASGRLIPTIDVSRAPVLNEGANGVIYKLSEEVLVKTFKKTPDYDDIIRERLSLRNALVAGVPAPFSLGYGEVDGKIAVLMEMLHSKSMLKWLREDSPETPEKLREYAELVRSLHAVRSENKLKLFPRHHFTREILTKADRIDPCMGERYAGRCRQIVEAIAEPECLVHGDIQPNNVMAGDDGMMFIDFDTFSTGKAVMDLGALFRTLLCDSLVEGDESNRFLKLSLPQCERTWNTFLREYYRDEPEETARRGEAEARIIGLVLKTAKLVKSQGSPETLRCAVSLLERYIDEYDARCGTPETAKQP